MRRIPCRSRRHAPALAAGRPCPACDRSTADQRPTAPPRQRTPRRAPTVFLNGQRRPLREWLDHFGLRAGTYYERLRHWRSKQLALSVPRGESPTMLMIRRG